MNVKKKLVFVVLVLLIGGGAYALLSTSDNQTDARPGERRIVRAAVNDNGMPFRSMKEYEKISKYGALPRSLQGTSIPWKLSYDANGRLIVTRELHRVFESFLLAAGEEGMDKALGRIREYIGLNLPEPAEKEALAILDGYMKYRDSLTRFKATADISTDRATFLEELKTAFDERRALRRKYLSPEVVDVFFSHQEAYDNFSYQRLEVSLNESLTNAEKDGKIAKLEEQLPEESRGRFRHQREERNLKMQIEALKAEGGNEDKIYELRKDFYGEEVAKRWAYVEDNSKEWNQKMSQFFEAKESILAAPGLSQEEKDRQLQETRRSLFNGKEQMKLAYYELQRQLPKKE